MKYLVLILLVCCTSEVDTGSLTAVLGGVEVALDQEGLFGLPSNYCPAQESCTTMKVANLNTNGGSDFYSTLTSTSVATGVLRGAAQLYWKGDKMLWCRNDLPSGQASCESNDHKYKMTIDETNWTADRKFREVFINITDTSLVHKTWHAFYSPFDSKDKKVSWYFVYNLCPQGLPVGVDFKPNRSSSAEVRICWGGK